MAKFEEMLEQERRHHIEKGTSLPRFAHQSTNFNLHLGVNLPFHGRTEMDNADVRIFFIGPSSEILSFRMMKMLMKQKKKVKEVNQMMKWMLNKVLDRLELLLPQLL